MPSTPDKEQLRRWRLILGQHAQHSLAKMGGAGGCELSAEQLGMDEALAAIYDETGAQQSRQRSAGLGPRRRRSRRQISTHCSSSQGPNFAVR